MPVRFFDREDLDSPSNGTVVADADTLRHLMVPLLDKAPRFVELVGEGDHTLLVGVGPLGCAQFGSADGRGAALVALAPGGGDTDDYIDFMIGGTATPVPARFCMPFPDLLRIAAHFVVTERRSLEFTWSAA